MPGVFTQLLHRVRSGLESNADFVFNCQMGRGRTTTGMVTACLIATTDAWSDQECQADPPVEDTQEEFYDSLDGPSEEEAYMQGKCIRICGLFGDGSNRFHLPRRIQTHPPTRGGALAWEGCEEVGRPGHRSDGGRPKPSKGHLPVRELNLCH